MNGKVTWEKAACYLFPDGAPELEPWRKAIIIAHLERCLAEFGSDFCESKRGLMISQLTRKGMVHPLEHQNYHTRPPFARSPHLLPPPRPAGDRSDSQAIRARVTPPVAAPAPMARRLETTTGPASRLSAKKAHHGLPGTR